MPLVEITARRVVNAEPMERQRIVVDLEMSDAQVFEAIDALLDAGGPEKRAQRMAQLAQNTLEGMHA